MEAGAGGAESAGSVVLAGFQTTWPDFTLARALCQSHLTL